MSKPSGLDQGQALPLFIWITGAVLFASFAFFALAQAAVARGGAQSAADAAALAAAQEERTELIEGLSNAIVEEEDDWLDWLDAGGAMGAGAPEAAARLADANDSHVIEFGKVSVDGNPGSRVEVRTRYPVGESMIPGTENQRARAEATAIVVPMCKASAEYGETIEFSCEGSGDFSFDADSFSEGDLPDASVLFMVHLVG
ncbi:pilus assembly protein TadG-related protein [Streptomyces sp. NPDC058372]|uniref:pilus assembly protein TadG-related protein n=1 Tax=Streptomyces sp. NPDC058372 TaxID=3346464 RepID=UPI00364F7E8D